jgi:hypothetical protein
MTQLIDDQGLQYLLKLVGMGDKDTIDGTTIWCSCDMDEGHIRDAAEAKLTVAGEDLAAPSLHKKE